MSDWEEEDDDGPKKQPPPRRIWTRGGVRGPNVHFGMRYGRQERSDEHEAREAGKGDRRGAFQQNRGSGDDTRRRDRPLVFNVERPSIGRIIGKLQSLELT